jgi:arylamine N-acetyltransferase
VVDVNPRRFFGKISKQKGRGGYCMEANSLLHTLLLTLGSDVYMAGTGVYDPGRKSYGGFTHCGNMLRIRKARYMVDVGFGANGPSAAMPLQFEREHTHFAPAKMRLVHKAMAQNVNQDFRVWIYQHKIDERAVWVSMHCFVDFEFILEDIQHTNFSPSTSRSSFFAQKVVT